MLGHGYSWCKGGHPRANPLKLRSGKTLLDEVSTGLEGTRPVNTEAATRAVFQVLNYYLDPAQIATVRSALSKPVRRLWPESATEMDAQTTERSERSLESTES